MNNQNLSVYKCCLKVKKYKLFSYFFKWKAMSKKYNIIGEKEC